MARKIASKFAFVKWEKVGDTVEGIADKMENVEFPSGDTGLVLFMRGRNGDPIEVTAGKVIRDAITDNDLLGKVVRIVFTKDTKNAKNKPLKLFDVYDLSDEYATEADYLASAKGATKAKAKAHASDVGLPDDGDDDLPF